MRTACRTRRRGETRRAPGADRPDPLRPVPRLLDGRFHGMSTEQVIATLIVTTARQARRARARNHLHRRPGNHRRGENRTGPQRRRARSTARRQPGFGWCTDSGPDARDPTAGQIRATSVTATGCGRSPYHGPVDTASGHAAPEGSGPHVRGSGGPGGRTLASDSQPGRPAGRHRDPASACPPFWASTNTPPRFPGSGSCTAPDARVRVALQAPSPVALRGHRHRRHGLLSEGVTRPPSYGRPSRTAHPAASSKCTSRPRCSTN